MPSLAWLQSLPEHAQNTLLHALAQLSPREVEARILATDPASADVVARMEAMPQPDLQGQIEGAVVSAAQRAPETVEVQMSPFRNPNLYGQTRVPGAVDRPVQIQVSPEGPHVPKTMAHELLHFLNAGLMARLGTGTPTPQRPATGLQSPWWRGVPMASPWRPPTMQAAPGLEDAEGQHTLIHYLLGADTPSGQGAPLQRGTDPALYAVYRYAVEQAFQDPQLRAQILRGLTPPPVSQEAQ
jgi:hypothetical protein